MTRPFCNSTKVEGDRFLAFPPNTARGSLLGIRRSRWPGRSRPCQETWFLTLQYRNSSQLVVLCRIDALRCVCKADGGLSRDQAGDGPACVRKLRPWRHRVGRMTGWMRQVKGGVWNAGCGGEIKHFEPHKHIDSAPERASVQYVIEHELQSLLCATRS